MGKKPRTLNSLAIIWLSLQAACTPNPDAVQEARAPARLQRLNIYRESPDSRTVASRCETAVPRQPFRDKGCAIYSAPSEEAAWRQQFPEELRDTCQKCHGLPPPSSLPKQAWKLALPAMQRTAREFHLEVTDLQMDELIAYYVDRSPASVEPLPHIDGGGSLTFSRQRIGRAQRTLPMLVHVNVVDLDQDGAPDILACDARNNEVTWLKRMGDQWIETAISAVQVPVHTAVFDHDGDGDLDIVVAGLGDLLPSDKIVGRVVLLINQGDQTFEKKVLLSGVARIADVEPTDFDGDGDFDFTVAMFGLRKTGSIGWLEQTGPGEFQYHNLFSMPGTIHIPVADMNGDGWPDFVAGVAQHHELVLAFINDGGGRILNIETLFDAHSPLFGSSGIELVDLDGDGDLDVLHTNGDSFDFYPGLRPYHGIRWLENQGNMKFVAHELTRIYGAFSPKAADLDGDGDLDIVVSSFANDWHDLRRPSLIWLENDGHQRFTPHAIDNTPTDIVSIDLADLNGDGRVDIVAGGHYFPLGKLSEKAQRRIRLSIWHNGGVRGH